MSATSYNVDKGLPASPDAEKAILGAMMLENPLIDEAVQTVKSEYFYLDAHRRVFSRILDLWEKNRPVDTLTLAEELGANKELEAIGGVTYLSSLTDGVPRRASIEHYIRIIRDKAILRGVIHAANGAIAMAIDGQDKAEEVLDGLESCLVDLRSTGRSFRSFKEMMQGALKEIERLQQVPDGVMLGRSLGFSRLDELTTGIRDSELWIIGARPNVGKTPFAMQIALANAAANVPVAVFSLEMSELQLAMRCLAHAGCATAYKLRDPRRMDKVQTRYAFEAAAEVAPWPIYVDDTPELSVNELRAKVRWAVHSLGVKLVIVDYLQLLEAPGKDPYQRVSAAARACRALTRETTVPIVALSQLNRNAKNPENPPSLGDLRESGVIEQEANVVCLIHRPPENVEEPSVLSVYGDFILAKVREGVCGPEKFEFDTRSLTFK